MRLRLIGMAMALICAASAPALAQYSTAPQTSKRFKGQAKPEPSALPPPSALPGATAAYAPAERTETDLAPTDALFDAINRGDIVSARDALGRGADLNGHNVLGMTPLELSVDLSRNDITFLLLSLRGADSTRSALAAPAGKPPAGSGSGPGHATATRPASAPAPAPAKLATKPAPKPAAPVAQSATPAARQYAGPGDAGTPAPQAGFLGFGGGAGAVQ